MSPFFYELSLVQNDDFIGIFYGAHSMGYQNNRNSISTQQLDCILNKLLGDRI